MGTSQTMPTTAPAPPAWREKNRGDQFWSSPTRRRTVTASVISAGVRIRDVVDDFCGSVVISSSRMASLADELEGHRVRQPQVGAEVALEIHRGAAMGPGEGDRGDGQVHARVGGGPAERETAGVPGDQGAVENLLELSVRSGAGE